MKRCPHCEFIYEDDQNLCDMDGSHLVFDSQVLPNLQALQEVGPPVTHKRNWKGHSVPAFASLILVVVLFLVYFVSIRTFNQPVLQRSSSTAGSQLPAVSSKPTLTGDTSQPTVNVNGNNPIMVESQLEEGAEPRGNSSDNDATHNSAKKESSSKTDNATKVRSADSQRGLRPSKSENEKKDSKVGSLLKKTGKILKKPFKF